MYYEDYGVSYSTYKETIAYNFLTSKLFSFYYEKADDAVAGSGSKAVSDEEIAGAINNYAVLADHIDNKLSATYDEDGNSIAVSDEERDAAKAKLQGYADRINKGTSFDTIKAEFAAESGSTDTDTSSTVPSSDTATSIYTATAKAYTKNDSDTTNYNLFNGFKDTEGFEYGKAMVVEGDTDDFKMVIIYDLSRILIISRPIVRPSSETLRPMNLRISSRPRPKTSVSPRIPRSSNSTVPPKSTLTRQDKTPPPKKSLYKTAKLWYST